MIPRTPKYLINTKTESPYFSYFTKDHFLVIFYEYGKLLGLSNALSPFEITELFDPSKFNKLDCGTLPLCGPFQQSLFLTITAKLYKNKV